MEMTLQIYTGVPPFIGYVNDLQVVMAVTAGTRPNRPTDCKIYDELWKLAARCWVADQEARPNMQEVSEEVGQSLTLVPSTN
jgi:hypothetical protein